MRVNYFKFGILIALFLILSACSNTNQDSPQETLGDNTTEAQFLETNEGKELLKTSRGLLTELINIEASNDSDEVFEVIDNIVLDPKKYIKTLNKNNLMFEYGRYDKVTIAHREEKMKVIGDEHFEFSSIATIEMFAGEEEPSIGYANIKMEIKKDNKTWKVKKLNISPQE